MGVISLEQANTIVRAAFDRARELDLKPISVAVLDAGGHLICLQRQDGSSTMRPQIAIGKASGALSLGVSSRVIAGMAAERPTFVASIASISPHGIIPAAGGVVVVDETGFPIGAVGVTGDTSDNDEICSYAGITASGLVPQA